MPCLHKAEAVQRVSSHWQNGLLLACADKPAYRLARAWKIRAATSDQSTVLAKWCSKANRRDVLLISKSRGKALRSLKQASKSTMQEVRTPWRLCGGLLLSCLGLMQSCRSGWHQRAQISALTRGGEGIPAFSWLADRTLRFVVMATTCR